MLADKALRPFTHPGGLEQTPGSMDMMPLLKPERPVQ
jgi:hypothetical protein